MKKYLTTLSKVEQKEFIDSLPMGDLSGATWQDDNITPEQDTEYGGLLLTRKIGDSIIINDNIKVTVRRVKGYQVALQIQAPRDVSIDREEIHDRKKAGVKQNGEK